MQYQQFLTTQLGSTPTIGDSPMRTTGRFTCPDHENEGRCYRLNAILDTTDGNSIGKTFMNFILGGLTGLEFFFDENNIHTKKTNLYLSSIKTNVESKEVMLGSIVKTNMMNFYISTSIGKIELEDTVFYAISVNSPIGQLLINKSVNASFEFNQNKYVITEII